jgi:hypothetical protein
MQPSTLRLGSDAFVFDGAETDYRRMMMDPGPGALVRHDGASKR